MGSKGRPKKSTAAFDRPSTQGQMKNTANAFYKRTSADEYQPKALPGSRYVPFSEYSPVRKGRSKTSFSKRTSLRKSSSPERSYHELKSKILTNLKVEKVMPNPLNEGCKTFYWAPDFSF